MRLLLCLVLRRATTATATATATATTCAHSFLCHLCTFTLHVCTVLHVVLRADGMKGTLPHLHLLHLLHLLPFPSPGGCVGVRNNLVAIDCDCDCSGFAWH